MKHKEICNIWINFSKMFNNTIILSEVLTPIVDLVVIIQLAVMYKLIHRISIIITIMLILVIIKLITQIVKINSNSKVHNLLTITITNKNSTFSLPHWVH